MKTHPYININMDIIFKKTKKPSIIPMVDAMNLDHF